MEHSTPNHKMNSRDLQTNNNKHHKYNNNDDNNHNYNNNYNNNDLSGIYQGILNDDVSMLQESVDRGVKLNSCFHGDSSLQHIGMTPLALAAALNKLQALQFLLRNGAHINDTFASLKTTALMTSAFHGHFKVVETLLRHGANVEAIDLQGSTALGYAFGGSRSLEVIDLLIKRGINIKQKNMLGMDAFLLVAGYGDVALVRMVLSAQSNANAVNDFGHSALHLVIVGKRSQLKKLIQDGCTGVNNRLTLDNFNNLKSAEVALKDWAVKNKQLQTDTQQLEKAADLMSNIGSKLPKCLVKAVEDNEQEVIRKRVEAVWLYRQDRLLANKKMLKRSGKLENLLGCRGKKEREEHEKARPYLSVASRSIKQLNTEKDKEVSVLKEKFASILTMIAQAGCDVGLTEKTFGMTALDMAILLEDVESTGHLVAMGADPQHLLKMFALSDLHEAIVTADKRILEKLISYDSDLDLNDCFSAFNVETKSNGEINRGEINEAVISEGLTPLCVAVQMEEDDASSIKITKTLLKNKADIDKIGPGGSFALAEAARTGNLRMCELLVSHGALVDQISPRYNNATPFLIAALFNRSDVAQFLVDRRAMVDHETTDGRCALTEAFRNDNVRLIETVMRGSLGSAFKDRLSFTYEMVAKYQRPDKNMNLIMKLIGHQVKKVDGIKSDFKPKETKSNYTNIKKNVNENVDGRNSKTNSRHSKEDVSKKSFVSKVSRGTSELGEVNEAVIMKSVGRTLEKGEILKNEASSRIDGSLKHEVQPFVNRMSSEIAKEKDDFLTGSKGFIRQGNNNIERNFKELKNDIQKNVSDLRDGNYGTKTETKTKTHRSFTETTADIHRSAESPIVALIENAEKASEKLKKNKDLTNSTYNTTFYKNQNPETAYISTNRGSQGRQYSENSVRRYCSETKTKDDDDEKEEEEEEEEENEEEEEEEEWEDERGFKEHYYPANTQEACMMTTPILGRCSQLRDNFAQADSYLRDVVSAGQSNGAHYSAIRSFQPTESEEEDEEVQIGKVSEDFRSLDSKKKYPPYDP